MRHWWCAVMNLEPSKNFEGSSKSCSYMHMVVSYAYSFRIWIHNFFFTVWTWFSEFEFKQFKENIGKKRVASMEWVKFQTTHNKSELRIYDKEMQREFTKRHTLKKAVQMMHWKSKMKKQNASHFCKKNDAIPPKTILIPKREKKNQFKYTSFVKNTMNDFFSGVNASLNCIPQ